jgi:hypothetical protein
MRQRYAAAVAIPTPHQGTCLTTLPVADTSADEKNAGSMSGGPDGLRADRLTCLIIRLIIQTIRRDRSGSVWIDDAPDVSSPDPSGANQADAEHQATDLAVGETTWPARLH